MVWALRSAGQVCACACRRGGGIAAISPKVTAAARADTRQRIETLSMESDGINEFDPIQQKNAKAIRRENAAHPMDARQAVQAS